MVDLRCAPPSSLGEGGDGAVLTLALVGGLVLVAVGSFDRLKVLLINSRQSGHSLEGGTGYLLLAIVLFISGMIVVDLATPMSTSRNYIVLLPATMVVLSNSLVGLGCGDRREDLRKMAATILASALAFSLWSATKYQVSLKAAPFQNWRKLAEFVAESKMCTSQCFVIGGRNVYRYYFDAITDARFVELWRRPGKTKARMSFQERVAIIKAQPAVPILVFHSKTEIAELMDDGKVCFQPAQSNVNGVVAIMPKDSTFPEQARRSGLVPCG